MNSGVARTLAGAPDAPLHLAEHSLGAVDFALPPLAPESNGENFILLLGLAGPAARCRTLGLGWHLEPDSLVWLRQPAPIHLRTAGLRPASLIAWRFTTAALPPELADLVLALPFARRLLLGPRPLLPDENLLFRGIRSCPVAPALRPFWATAKLVELITHLLPAPPGSGRAATFVAVPRPDAVPPAVRTALAYMEAHLADPIGLAELSAAACQSPSHFSRIFSETINRGPTAHLRLLRMEHAARLLSSGQVNVTEASFAVGYQSLGQFSRVFSEHHGKPPSAFLPRNNG
jgi:AraC-like DNA-binding protein